MIAFPAAPPAPPEVVLEPVPAPPALPAPALLAPPAPPAPPAAVPNVVSDPPAPPAPEAVILALLPLHIVIIPHKNPDGDAMGSCLAWQKVLQQVNHHALVRNNYDM